MPTMIYGTAWKKEKTANLVELALKCGFRAIDTACQPKHYREDLVGIGLKNAFKSGLKKDDIFIQTKFTPIGGQERTNMPYFATDNVITQLEKSFLKSQQNLQVDFIDSYILHSPIFPMEETLKVLQHMQDYVKEGKIGQIGISNCYDIKLLQFLFDEADIALKVVQNRFYKETDYDKEVRAFCKQNDIMYQSFWSLTANPHLLENDAFFSLAQKYNKTAPQIFYKFLQSIEITPLNGTTSKTHMIEDLNIEDFSLEENEIKNLCDLL